MSQKALSVLRTNLLAIGHAAEKMLLFTQSVCQRLDCLRKLPLVGGTFADLQDAVYMLNDYCSGSYRKLPVSVILGVLAIGAYAASPLDIIPDELPIIGAIDDLFVARLIIGLCIDRELENYRAWKEAQTAGGEA